MTLDQLRYFVAVVDSGGFGAAARALHISQPSVSVAIKSIEARFSVELFSRDSYRAKLTEQGEAIYQRAVSLLGQAAEFESYAEILGQGDEPELSIAIIESAPFDIVIKLLAKFFRQQTNTKLKIHCEGVRGAFERLMQEKSHIALTGDRDVDPDAYDSISVGSVLLVPVVSSLHPAASLASSVTEVAMKKFVQVIIRDTAQTLKSRDFGVVQGAASSCTVNDQQSKKQLIMAGLGWGRLPHYMIQDELNSGALVSLEGGQIATATIVSNNLKPQVS